MSQLFVPGAPQKGYAGVGIFSTDPPTGSAVSFAFASEMIRAVKSDSRDYADAVDNAGMTHISIPGVKTALITVAGFMQPDRTFHTLLNTAFGPRTNGQLVPWTMALIPYGGAAQIKMTGLWWGTVQIMGNYAQRGRDGRVGFVLNGIACDPENVLALADQPIPAAAGAIGAGVTHFIQAGFTDGQTTPTNYDLVRAFNLSLTNQLTPQPSAKDRANRIGSGYTPGPLRGVYALTQMKGAAQPLPRVAGVYPQQLILPTGDGTHSLAIDLSTSYDEDGMSTSPLDYVPDAISYTVFSKSAGATTTGGWNMVASYA